MNLSIGSEHKRRSQAPQGSQIDDWACSLVNSVAGGAVVGVMSGSRFPNDRRTVDGLATKLASSLQSKVADPRMLLLRLNVFHSANLERQVDQSSNAPKPTRSPFGAWSDVEVPVPIGRTASWSLERLPHWVWAWRRSFGLIAIDLGPMHQVPSRVLGRLCDHAFILLGPDSCDSPDWIKTQIDWHRRSGVTVAGTLVTSMTYASEVDREVSTSVKLGEQRRAA